MTHWATTHSTTKTMTKENASTVPTVMRRVPGPDVGCVGGVMVEDGVDTMSIVVDCGLGFGGSDDSSLPFKQSCLPSLIQDSGRHMVIPLSKAHRTVGQ